MYEELPYLFGLVAIFSLRLDIHLPLAAESVEVIYEVSPHEGLKSLVHLSQIDALLEHFVPVHIDEYLRNTGQEGRRHALQLRPLARSLEKFIHVLS